LFSFLLVEKNRKDPQALLAMGNYWFNTYYSKKSSDDSPLKMSYKFYHPVLSEHVRNIYAANGLGIICAIKNEMEASREIFSKIRQGNMKNTEDTDINLANVYMSEKRYLEAERLYYSVLKNIPTNTAFQHYHYSTFLNLIGVSQYGSHKYEEAFKTMLKAWHMTPMEVNVLFNFSIISNQIANMCIDRSSKTSDEIDIISNIVKVSVKTLHYLSLSKKHIGVFDQKDLVAKENTAKVCLSFCLFSSYVLSFSFFDFVSPFFR
jgi:tetratricopeptide (TPR) repeat protein